MHRGYIGLQVLPGGQGARTYQDERFSYVVLRRGPRPGSHTIPDFTIARQRQIDPPDAVQQAIEAGDGRYPTMQRSNVGTNWTCRVWTAPNQYAACEQKNALWHAD